MTGILRKSYGFLLGKDENRIDIYGGNKGGFGMLLVYDNTKKEVIGQYVTTPQKTSKSVDVNGGIPGVASIGVKYQSEVEFGKSFAIENASKTSPITLDDEAQIE
jgi:hypothetical protein